MAEEIKKEKAEAAKKKTAEKKPADDKRLKAELEDTKKKLEAKEIELSEQNDKYMRMIAEYDNFRKRTAKEKEGIYTDAFFDAIGQILPIIDNVERAAAFKESEQVAQGIEMILKSFNEMLAKNNVTAYGEAGEEFDPNIHNAVMHVEDEALGENVIAEVFQKGYRKDEKILRYAMVKVAN